MPSTPLTYVVEDSSGNTLAHKFYEPEMLLVSPPQIRDIDDLKEGKKSQEKGEKTPLQQQHEQENKEYYIAGERRPESRTLRSGTQTASKIEYELRDKKHPRFVRFIDATEKKKLEDDGLLLHSSSV